MTVKRIVLGSAHEDFLTSAQYASEKFCHCKTGIEVFLFSPVKALGSVNAPCLSLKRGGIVFTQANFCVRSAYVIMPSNNEALIVPWVEIAGFQLKPQ